ncbi:MAG: hypothetical protein AMXMBFR34_39130 [Myxococcaceae bacterium]
MRFLVALAALTLCVACSRNKDPGFIAFFNVTPDIISPGQSAQLSWQALNADGCRITPDIGAVPAEGSWLVSPTKRTVFQLSCAGATTVRVLDVLPEVHVLSFTASTLQTIPDGAVKLAWATEGAERCEVKPGFADVALSGSLDVNPTQTTAYTLSCTGFGGPATAQLTVTVVPAMNLEVPTNPQAVAGDSQLTLTWTQAVGAANVYFAEAPNIDAATIESMAGGVIYRRVGSPLVLTGLANGRTYSFRVSAVSGPDETALSTEASGTPVAGAAVADPYFSEQWHVLPDGGEDMDVAQSWTEGVRGDGVPVAIVDEGVDLAHEDLAQNVATLRSYDYVGSAPVRWAEHGTCVAGLVAARDWNGKGVRGVAPRAAILSYNVLQDLTSTNEKDAMVRGKEYVQVSNNSWGDVDDGTGLVTTSDAQWLEGVREGATTGRGGKGILYFWAAGNGADSPYEDNSNYDGQANRRFVLSISGYGKNGMLAGYAESGANVLVSAPTEGNDLVALTTTDITGRSGYNDGRRRGSTPTRTTRPP